MVCKAISCLLANLYRHLCATQAIGLTMEISMRICTEYIVSLSSVPFIAMMLQLYKERSLSSSQYLYGLVLKNPGMQFKMGVVLLIATAC